MKKEVSSYKMFYDILEKNKDKIEELKLSELPTAEQYKLNRKMTDEEKMRIETRVAAVGAYIASPFADRRNKIPEDMLQNRVFEQGDPERMTFTQRKDFIAQLKEGAMDQYDEQRAERLKKKTVLA